MPVGITGTREGCTHAQYRELQQLLEDLMEVHGGVLLHGDCVGVDAEAHLIGRRLGYEIEIFPPTDPKHRAFLMGDYNHPKKSYKDRNQDIVNACSVLVVVPQGPEEANPRSGTWQTYRMAQRLNKPFSIVKGNRW